MSKKRTSLSIKSRRDFVKSSGLAAAGFMIVPRHVLGGPGFVPPSDTLNIAGIGAGGKGESDIASFAESPNVNIVGLCDVDDGGSGSHEVERSAGRICARPLIDTEPILPSGGSALDAV